MERVFGAGYGVTKTIVALVLVLHAFLLLSVRAVLSVLLLEIGRAYHHYKRLRA